MFCSIRISTPHIGKGDIAKARMRTAAGIISRNGASGVWMASVLGGYGAGTNHLYAFFDTMTHAMEVSANIQGDPAWHDLMAERERNPSADVAGPSLWRRIFGVDSDAEENAVMQRHYIMPRANLAAAMEMLPEAQKMLDGTGVRVHAWAPVIAEDMTRIGIAYSGADMVTIAKSVDEVGTSEPFQAMLAKASELGTLDRSLGLVTMR